VVDGGAWRQCTGGARGRGCCRASLGLLIHHEDAQRYCEQGPGVRAVWKSTGGEQLPRRSSSLEMTSRRNSGETQAELEGKGGTALLDIEAELWRVLAGVEVQRGGGCMATQRCCAAEQGG
jgi:hypothetical protein